MNKLLYFNQLQGGWLNSTLLPAGPLYETHDYTMFFVNFTPDQIASPDFINALRWFDDNGVHASSVVIEVTELRCKDEHDDIFLKNIALLRRKGHLIALDDFGSGYSNLARVLFLQPHIIKIDQSLLHLSSHSAEHKHTLHALVSFLHNIGTKCVVEGTEDEELLLIAQQSGADYLQGYHLSRPTLIMCSPLLEPVQLESQCHEPLAV